MARRLFLAPVLALPLLGTGCGTLDNINAPRLPPPDNPNAKVCRLYGGVRSDVATMLEYPWSQTSSPIDYVMLPPLAVLDIFLDLCGDTLTLPYTGYEEVRRAFWPGVPEPSPSGYPRLTRPLYPPGSAPLPTPVPR